RAHLRRGFAHDEIEVEPGAESSGHAACQHDRANIVIGCGAPQCRNELLEHRKVERIDWRTLDADLRNPAGRLVTNKIFHDWSILRCWRYRQGRKIIEHDPEKWEPVFGKRSCSNKELERDDDSKKNHPALADLRSNSRMMAAAARISNARQDHRYDRGCTARGRGDLACHRRRAIAAIPGRIRARS